MLPDENIFLVGLMGSGKTTVGRCLARQLKRKFIDSDQEIEQRTGVSVATIFEIEGELGFRNRETQTIENLVLERGVVIATGGGVVLNSANCECLSKHGFVIYLDVPADIIYQRIKYDKKRPLLQVSDPLYKLRELYKERDPMYRSIADYVVDGAKLNAYGMVRHLMKLVCKL